MAQPRATFDGRDLYVGLKEKAAALCFSLIKDHGFVDGNKRVAHAALEIFLLLNGFELFEPDVDEQEQFFLGLASGAKSRQDLIAWIEPRVRRSDV